MEEAQPVNMNRLLFQRWLVQNGRGEHFPESRPVGELAMAMVLKSNKPIEDAVRDAMRPRSVREQVERTGDY